jgi:hypothetical protein
MPNLLKLAIVAAGGNSVIAARYGMSRGMVSAWVARGSFPPDKVADLCGLGGNVIKADSLLGYLADIAAEKARARVLERAAA